MVKLLDTLPDQWKLIFGEYESADCAEPTSPLSLIDIGETLKSSAVVV
jgi:hypothetical protein